MVIDSLEVELYRVSTFGLKWSQTESGQVHYHRKWICTFPASTAPKHRDRYDMSAIDDTTQNTTHKKKLNTAWCRQHVFMLGWYVCQNWLFSNIKCRHLQLRRRTAPPSLLASCLRRGWRSDRGGCAASYLFAHCWRRGWRNVPSFAVTYCLLLPEEDALAANIANMSGTCCKDTTCRFNSGKRGLCFWHRI